MFWDQFIKLCNEHNTKPNPVAKELGISSGILTKWKSGSLPSTDALLKISEYFNVSIDYLLGRTEHMNYSTNNGSVINSGSNNNIQNGNNNNMNTYSERQSMIDLNNMVVAQTYNELAEKDKLAVQMYILETAEKAEK